MPTLKSGPPTAAEQILLAQVLREIRHVVKTGEQLTIIVDPWRSTRGVNVFYSYNGSGWSCHVEGVFRAARKRTRHFG
jgi:hypothetical protein